MSPWFFFPISPFTISLLSRLCCLPLYASVAIFPSPNIGLMYKGLSNSNVSVQTKTPLPQAAKVSHPPFQKMYIQQSLNSEINYYLSNTLGFDQSSLNSGNTLPEVSLACSLESLVSFLIPTHIRPSSQSAGDEKCWEH